MIKDTIVALATPSGAGAIAVIRISGPDAIAFAANIFRSQRGKDLARQRSHTVSLGYIVDGDKTLDQVLATVFHDPNSYTGENTVEISCHGSIFIQQQVIQLLLRNGCRMANPGEFTLRAFLNGKIDLSQAEAVADLIASDNEASHRIAMQQMRGGFSNELARLRSELLNFASLIELELDFAEEDVAFADRTQFRALLNRIESVLKRLIDSFATGNVIKNGIPVAIAGEPNVGKSTLLNALLNEEKALVSHIAGTTRDAIEDEIVIGGIGFRFIDTAGIRETEDVVEGMGIRRTFEKMASAQVILYMVDGKNLVDGCRSSVDEYSTAFPDEIAKITARFPDKPLIIIANKADLMSDNDLMRLGQTLSESHLPLASNTHPATGNLQQATTLILSAKNQSGIEALKSKLLSFIDTGALRNSETIVTNARHYDSLIKALEEIIKVKHGLESGLSSDLMAIDIREALYHFGMITGEVTNDELLGNIFANFCIGK